VKRSSFSLPDLILPAAVLVLVAVGVLFIYSAGLDTGSARNSGAWIRQLIWAVTGIAIMLFLTFFSISTVRTYALAIYAANLVLIVVTLLFGAR
jgi:rod shape determining protein RodA